MTSVALTNKFMVGLVSSGAGGFSWFRLSKNCNSLNSRSRNLDQLLCQLVFSLLCWGGYAGRGGRSANGRNYDSWGNHYTFLYHFHNCLLPQRTGRGIRRLRCGWVRARHRGGRSKSSGFGTGFQSGDFIWLNTLCCTQYCSRSLINGLASSRPGLYSRATPAARQAVGVAGCHEWPSAGSSTIRGWPWSVRWRIPWALL